MFFALYFGRTISQVFDVLGLKDKLEYLSTSRDVCAKVNDASVFLYRLPNHWLEEVKTGNFSNYLISTRTFSNRENILTDMSQLGKIQENIDAFESLCTSISGCGLVSQDPVWECVLTSPEKVVASGASHVSFFWIVVIVTAFFVLLHLVKIIAVFVSLWNDELWLSQYTAHSISSSVLSPLFLLVGNMRNKFVYGVLLYQSQHNDHIRHLMTEGLLVSIPLLIVNAYYWLAVVQTGLSVPNIVSLISGGFMVPITLFRAYRSFRMQQQGEVDQDTPAAPTIKEPQTESDIDALRPSGTSMEMSDFTPANPSVAIPVPAGSGVPMPPVSNSSVSQGSLHKPQAAVLPSVASFGSIQPHTSASSLPATAASPSSSSASKSLPPTIAESRREDAVDADTDRIHVGIRSDE
jgi:hypothetical protein